MPELFFNVLKDIVVDDSKPDYDPNDSELIQYLYETGKPLFEFEERQLLWGNGPMPDSWD